MKISLVTPSYNQAQFLEKTIQSVLEQNYANLEWIVMDGGSNDGSAEILKANEAHFTHWQSERDDGQSAAINAGMNRATGDICCWLNSDDLLAPGALKTVAEFFEKNPKEQWLIGKGGFCTPAGKVLREKPVGGTSYEDFLDWGTNSINQPSVFWRRSLWKEVGGLNETLNFVMDYELWLKFSRVQAAAKIPQVLGITVIHKDTKTAAGATEMYIEHSLVLYEFGHKDLAMKRLKRPLDRAFKIGRAFAPLKRIGLVQKLLDR
jgi:glycosyltransferase involved in cell wall biosynthesis